MRATMPYCPVQAVTGTGDSYAAAFEGMEQARRDGSFLVDSPPAPPEVILAKPCDQCRSAAAVHEGVVIVAAAPARDLCGDCQARFEAAGGTKSDRLRRSPLPERRMKEALEAAGMEVTGFPDDFKAMAAAGQHHQDDTATQLALIYADGNKVGRFLSRRPGRHARAAARPGRHSSRAGSGDPGRAGRRDHQPVHGWSRPPVLADLAGGDDLLAPVPAIDASAVRPSLLEAFGQHVDAATREWPDRPRRAALAVGRCSVPPHDRAVLRCGPDRPGPAEDGQAGHQGQSLPWRLST